MARKIKTVKKFKSMTEVNTDEYLTFGETVSLLEVSLPGVVRWKEAGLLPNTIKVGRNVLIPKSDIIALIKSGRSTAIRGFDIERVENFKSGGIRRRTSRAATSPDAGVSVVASGGENVPNSITISLNPSIAWGLSLYSQKKGKTPAQFVLGLVEKEVAPALKLISKLK
jgi:predicted DNA-binding transcriptional regulator AlpA